MNSELTDARRAAHTATLRRFVSSITGRNVMHRSFILGLLAFALLAGAGTAHAAKAPVPGVICGTPCDGGGGTPYCGQYYHEDYYNDSLMNDGYRVWLGINWCANGSVITSASPYTYGCASWGNYSCGGTNGPFVVGGGVGQSYIHFRYGANLSFGAFPTATDVYKNIDCTAYGSGASAC